MGKWGRALDAAGIHEPRLRDDYGQLRKQAAAFKREIVFAADLLLPNHLVPHLITAIAFMHATDNLLDSGPVAQRKEAYTRWEHEVTGGLADGRTGNPRLRPLLNSVTAYPVLRERVRDYLAGATTDLDFTGFATEADYQRYLDAYSLPAFMLGATLLGPDGDQTAYRAGCRLYIDASQRLDFVNDLAEDLADDRLTLPEQTLEQYGVARADLERKRDLPAVRSLITGLLDHVDETLAESRAVIGHVPPAHQPMVRCLISLDELTVAAARADISALLHRSAGLSKPAAARLLVRAYVEARRVRR
ncbi:squalene/phytoene synthase family protein [Streptomyces sp. NPDC005195]|uniref:phytoene/squalene synthase family protein n=1 Tax=Streptomyces sp. NPDC005195 TaxID=3154561 RepID=UPI00339FFE12